MSVTRSSSTKTHHNANEHAARAKTLDSPRDNKHSHAIGKSAKKRAELEQHDGAKKNVLGLENSEELADEEDKAALCELPESAHVCEQSRADCGSFDGKAKRYVQQTATHEISSDNPSHLGEAGQSVSSSSTSYDSRSTHALNWETMTGIAVDTMDWSGIGVSMVRSLGCDGGKEGADQAQTSELSVKIHTEKAPVLLTKTESMSERNTRLRRRPVRTPSGTGSLSGD